MELQDFSFDFRDPFYEFGGLRFAFRLFTIENTYGLDPAKVTLQVTEDAFHLKCEGFTWAGGQKRCRGTLEVDMKKEAGVFEWTCRASHSMTLKSIATIIEGLPAGRFTHAFSEAEVWSMEEIPDGESALLVYPVSLKRFFGESLPTPLCFLDAGSGKKWFFQSLDYRTRPKRFCARRSGGNLRLELFFEERAELWKDKLETPPWRIGTCGDFREVALSHIEHIASAYNLTAWQERVDAPDWLRGICLLLNMHGAHWTGYIFNNYARQLEILKWLSARIDPRSVLVYLPGWDGRYYWNYPAYEPDPHMGGDEGFRKLSSSARDMGFHIMPMFGATAVNVTSPFFGRFIEARIRHPDGDHAQADWVDWDNDRHLDGWWTLLSLDAKSWRNFLVEKILKIIGRYGVDAVFLDISCYWTNDPRYDWVDGMARLVRAIHERFPKLLIVGEGYFDAILAHIPLVQAAPPRICPEILTKFARCTYHLSQGAPGSGSTGVHERGFVPYERPRADDPRIPQLSIVDDTFEKHRPEMEAVVEVAKEWAKLNGIS